MSRICTDIAHIAYDEITDCKTSAIVEHAAAIISLASAYLGSVHTAQKQ